MLVGFRTQDRTKRPRQNRESTHHKPDNDGKFQALEMESGASPCFSDSVHCIEQVFALRIDMDAELLAFVSQTIFQVGD